MRYVFLDGGREMRFFSISRGIREGKREILKSSNIPGKNAWKDSHLTLLGVALTLQGVGEGWRGGEGDGACGTPVMQLSDLPDFYQTTK